jgi:inorganic triphosphatase YgiF
MSIASKEVELKFSAPANCLDQLRSHPEFEAKLRAPIIDQTLVSTYYDFDNLSLRRHGLSLRVRQVGPHRMQTLKSIAGDGSPIAERTEFENEISGELPDLGTLHGSPLSPILAEQGHNALRPMFETKIHRKAFRIEENGAEIEFAVDTGEIIAAGSAAPVSEIELELKRGDPGQLFALAKTINAIVPMELTLRSKSETGYRLFDKQPTAASLAPPIALDPAMTAAEAFKHITRSCLRHLIANHALVLSHDARAVHQTRVAARRFRVAISAFSAIVADAEVEAIKAGLKHFAQALGPARDLDVLIDGVLKPFRAQHTKDKGAASLIRSFNRQRSKAYEAAARAIDSGEFRKFVITCAAWIESGPWTTDTDPGRGLLRQQPVAVHAAQQIAKRRKQCRRIGRDLDALTDAERHQVRIAVKKLRYTVDFFASLYPAGSGHKRKTAVLRGCQKLQDSLGALNDLVIRRALFAKLLNAKTAGATDRAFAAGLLLGSQEHETPMLKKKAAKAWKAILTAKPFWKLSATPPPIPDATAPPIPLSGEAA